MAMLALQAIFQGLPGRESPHIELFVRFLNTHDKLVSINSDQWKGFLQFSREVDTSFSGYSDADPWPSMFDDFVSWVVRLCSYDVPAPCVTNKQQTKADTRTQTDGRTGKKARRQADTPSIAKTLVHTTTHSRGV